MSRLVRLLCGARLASLVDWVEQYKYTVERSLFISTNNNNNNMNTKRTTKIPERRQIVDDMIKQADMEADAAKWNAKMKIKKAQFLKAACVPAIPFVQKSNLLTKPKLAITKKTRMSNEEIRLRRKGRSIPLFSEDISDDEELSKEEKEKLDSFIVEEEPEEISEFEPSSSDDSDDSDPEEEIKFLWKRLNDQKKKNKELKKQLKAAKKPRSDDGYETETLESYLERTKIENAKELKKAKKEITRLNEEVEEAKEGMKSAYRKLTRLSIRFKNTSTKIADFLVYKNLVEEFQKTHKDYKGSNHKAFLKQTATMTIQIPSCLSDDSDAEDVEY